MPRQTRHQQDTLLVRAQWRQGLESLLSSTPVRLHELARQWASPRSLRSLEVAKKAIDEGIDPAFMFET